MKFESIVKFSRKNHIRQYATCIEVRNGLATYSDGFFLIRKRPPITIEDGVYSFKEAIPNLSNCRFPKYDSVLPQRTDPMSDVTSPLTLFSAIRVSDKAGNAIRAVYNKNGKSWSLVHKLDLPDDWSDLAVFNANYMSMVCESNWEKISLKEDGTLYFYHEGNPEMAIVVPLLPN